MNSVSANKSQIGITATGGVGPNSVSPGGAITLTGHIQQVAVPGTIFVAGYNLGLLEEGVNNIPANVKTEIEGTNTSQGKQTRSMRPTAVSTTIERSQRVPGTGDETATPGAFTAPTPT